MSSTFDTKNIFTGTIPSVIKYMFSLLAKGALIEFNFIAFAQMKNTLILLTTTIYFLNIFIGLMKHFLGYFSRV